MAKRFCHLCQCDECIAERESWPKRFCESCDCKTCVERQRKFYLPTLQGVMTDDRKTMMAALKTKEKFEQTRMDWMVWMLINTATNESDAKHVTSEIAFALGTTYSEVNKMRKRAVKLIYKRVTNMWLDEIDDPAIRRLQAAGALNFIQHKVETLWANPPGATGTGLPGPRWPNRGQTQEWKVTRFEKIQHAAVVGGRYIAFKVDELLNSQLIVLKKIFYRKDPTRFHRDTIEWSVCQELHSKKMIDIKELDEDMREVTVTKATIEWVSRELPYWERT